MKCVTSSAVRPSTTGALSASARWRCFPPTPAMPGCWILPSGWPFDWRARAIPIQSTSMRPTPTSPSPGPGITTSTVQLSYTATESPIGFSPSLATPQTRSVNCAERENFKYFWLVLVVDDHAFRWEIEANCDLLAGVPGNFGSLTWWGLLFANQIVAATRTVSAGIVVRGGRKSGP